MTNDSGNSGRIMAIVALVLSIAAVAISVFEVSAMREQYTASVWPYVAVDQSYSAEGFSISIANKGIGPAVIGAVELRVAGEPVTDVGTFFEDFFAAREDDDYYAKKNIVDYYDYRTGDASFSVLAPGEESTLFGLPWQTRKKIRTERLVGDLTGAGIDVDVCYCSLSGECWTVELRQPLAKRVARCPGLDENAPAQLINGQ
ncbi:MAG: hypothetical protein AAGC71_12815 [Pseudomonadota bacterium]